MKAVFISCVLILTFSLGIFAEGQREPAQPGQTTIKFTRWAGAQEARDFQDLVNAFMKENPDIRVETEFLPWGAYWEKIRNSIISGDAADVMMMSSVMAAPYMARGAFLSMDAFSEASSLIQEMHPSAITAVRFDGRYFGVPVGMATKSVIYNKDHFDQAGLAYPDSEIPMTWDDFFEIASQLTRRNAAGEVTRYAAHWHKDEMVEALVNQFGGSMLDDLTQPNRITLNSPEGLRGMHLLQRMIEEELIPPHLGDWSGPWGTPDTAIATGRVTMMHSGSWGLGPVDQAGIRYGTAPLPVADHRANRGNINFLSIFRASRNQEAAYRFVEWMASEGQIAFSRTGDLPANTNAMEAALESHHLGPEIMGAFFNEVPYMISGPMLPNDQFLAMVEEAMAEFFEGRVSAEETVRRIEREGNEIIRRIFGR
ncbi:ABC transporter substrate-binding protein [Spirochaeta dissipatitropha]